MNPQGAITGTFGDSTGTHGFVRDNKGNSIVFDVLGAYSTNPFSINADGTITGTFWDSTGAHGFVRDRQGVNNRLRSTRRVSSNPVRYQCGGRDHGTILEQQHRTPKWFHSGREREFHGF
jgi:hypothetical protein